MNIIETHDLTKEFNGFTAVDGVNFSVEGSEIFGFLGPNGAGKTTTINMLTTLLTPTRGTAIVNGYDIVKEQNDVRKSIGIVPQEIVLENVLTARENLEFHGAIYGVSRREINERIPLLLDLIDLKDRADSKVKTFSSGMKRRLEIVKAFLHKPGIIFMDEPTQGLDPQTRRAMWDYITRLNNEEGVTIFLTTHYLEEADHLCKRVGIIDYGKILDLDTPLNLKAKIGRGVIIEFGVSGKVKEFLRRVEKDCECKAKILENSFIRIIAKQEDVVLPKLFKFAEELDIAIQSLSVREPTLEDIFIHYTGREIREERAADIAKAVMRKMVK